MKHWKLLLKLPQRSIGGILIVVFFLNRNYSEIISRKQRERRVFSLSFHQPISSWLPHIIGWWQTLKVCSSSFLHFSNLRFWLPTNFIEDVTNKTLIFRIAITLDEINEIDSINDHYLLFAHCHSEIDAHISLFNNHFSFKTIDRCVHWLTKHERGSLQFDHQFPRSSHLIELMELMELVYLTTISKLHKSLLAIIFIIQDRKSLNVPKNVSNKDPF